jgi:hypothetical protein
MECTEVAKKLQLFIDEELLYQEMESIRKHLSLCHGCEQRFETEKLFKQTLRNGLIKTSVVSTAMLEDVRHFIMDRAI